MGKSQAWKQEAKFLAALAMVIFTTSQATIISDGGFKCIFNANGVLASNAQRNMTTALNAAYNGNFLGCANHLPGPTTGGTWPFPDK